MNSNTRSNGKHLTVKGSNDDYVITPAGVHVAVCYGVFDLGTHREEIWNKDVHKVVILWEIPDARIQFEKDGEQLDLPRGISKRYRVSLHKKANLRHDLEAWRGRPFTAEELDGFDLGNLIGAACQLQVVHNPSRQDPGKLYANIGAIMALPKGMKRPAMENESAFWSFETAPKEPELPVNTPEWIAELIMSSDEWAKLYGDPGNGTQDDADPAEARPDETAKPVEDDDDLPF